MKVVNNFRCIDEYIVNAAPQVRPILREIRAVIRKTVPLAQETISYKMPAFKTQRTFVYFAAFKKHIGVYPPVENASLRNQLARFANEKGNLSFPLTEPIPYELIGEVAKALAEQYSHATARPRRY
jgi:uncharacterized protein YdhG (YjbR/CyaY superfamily)